MTLSDLSTHLCASNRPENERLRRDVCKSTAAGQRYKVGRLLLWPMCIVTARGSGATASCITRSDLMSMCRVVRPAEVVQFLPVDGCFKCKLPWISAFLSRTRGPT